MGQFFERILVLDKGISGLMTMMSGITKAAAAVGYQPCEDGLGIPVCFTQYPDSEWFDFQSPLLESPETAEPFLAALAKEGRVPVLSLICVDSDFVACRLFDTKNETDTIACLGTPYESFGEPDYTAWTAMCKKKWKCKPEQFKAVFESDYTFAEDGLTPLAALLHFSPAVLPERDERSADRTFWFLPNQELNETTRPHTLAEKLADYMEREYAAKFEAAGFRRFKNSPVRWHKVVGAPGNEVLLSMVFTVYHGYEIEPIYGAQSLYCPLTLSDQYYPLHDDMEYWREAKSEFRRRAYLAAERNQQEEERLPYRNEEALPVLIDELMLPELDEVKDLSSCRAYYLTPRKREYVLHENTPKMRVWIEAALDGDEAETQRWYEHEKAKADRILTLGRNVDPSNQELLKAYETGGREGLIGYLRDTVYRDNMNKLKRAGIV